jgi:glycosyltransferase involved in cell wall biosynthesis
MKIQVFIPTFNRAEKLKKAILSVLSQTWGGLEVVVLDNHSTDDTEQVVRSFMATDSRVGYIRRESNIGMIANFNSIGDLVSGDYFAVQADDDEYEPCFLDAAMKLFAEYRDIGFVACNALTKMHGAVTKSQLDYWSEGYYRSGTAIMKCLLGHYPLITNCLLRADLRKDFFFHSELGNTSDGFLLASLFAKYNAYVTKQVTGHWNNDGENASSLQKFDPILVVNTAISEYALYVELNRRGELASRWLLTVLCKRNLTILLASDKAGFGYVYEHSRMRSTMRHSSVFMLRVLHATRLVRIFLGVLYITRRLNVRYILWRERQHDQHC